MCSHFICDDCKSLNKDKPCLFCKNLISIDTLLCFGNLEELILNNNFNIGMSGCQGCKRLKKIPLFFFELFGICIPIIL